MTPDRLSSDLASLRIRRDADVKPGVRRRALLLAGALVAVAAAGALAGLRLLASRIFRAEVAVTEIALVSPAQASVELSATGYVVPQTRSRVGARVQGRVARVRVAEGERIEAGAVLVELEDADQASAAAAARWRAAAAQARAEDARVERADAERRFQRERVLAERGASSEATVEDVAARARALEQRVRAADAETAAAQAEVEMREAVLRDLVIRAPIGGTVLGKPPQPGEIVSPSSDAILDIADFSTLAVEADVPEVRIDRIRIGGPCEIVLDAYPSRRHRGAVLEVSPRVNRAKATVLVKVRFTDAAEGVLPDMAARVSFLARELNADAVREPPRLVVPASAVARRGDTDVVFVLEDGRVRMTPVTLGAAFANGFELARGPSAGTRVVREPPATLTDGQRIKESHEAPEHGARVAR